jgi:hypothetical protein
MALSGRRLPLRSLAFAFLALASACPGGVDSTGGGADAPAGGGDGGGGTADARPGSDGGGGGADGSLMLHGVPPAIPKPAPEFTATNRDGTTRTRADLTDGKPTIMWFYPAAGTPG